MSAALGHRKIALLEVAILPVEDHEPGSTIGQEEILDLVPEGVGVGGADDVIHHGVGERGIDPRGHRARGRQHRRWEEEDGR